MAGNRGGSGGKNKKRISDRRRGRGRSAARARGAPLGRRGSQRRTRWPVLSRLLCFTGAQGRAGGRARGGGGREGGPVLVFFSRMPVCFFCGRRGMGQRPANSQTLRTGAVKIKFAYFWGWLGGIICVSVSPLAGRPRRGLFPPRARGPRSIQRVTALRAKPVLEHDPPPSLFYLMQACERAPAPARAAPFLIFDLVIPAAPQNAASLLCAPAQCFFLPCSPSRPPPPFPPPMPTHTTWRTHHHCARRLPYPRWVVGELVPPALVPRT